MTEPTNLSLITESKTQSFNPQLLANEVDFSKSFTDIFHNEKGNYIPLKKISSQRVWIGYEDQKGFWQSCLYEKLPDYCKTCKKVGHSIQVCKVFDDKPVKKNMVEHVQNYKLPKVVLSSKAIPSIKQGQKHVVKGQRAYSHTKEKWEKKKETFKYHKKQEHVHFQVPICNSFQALTQQDMNENSLSLLVMEKERDKQLDNQKEKDKEAVVPYVPTLNHQENAEDKIRLLQSQKMKPLSEHLHKLPKALHCGAFPLNISVGNTNNLEPMQLEGSSKVLSEVNEENNIKKNSQLAKKQIDINERELVVDLYSSNWETEVDEEEEKRRKQAKIWKGIKISKEVRKVKAHRYNTRSKARSNNNYYDPHDYEEYGSC